MEKDELIKIKHEIAYKEVNHNRSVVNQLLYFSAIIIGAFLWFILNLNDKSFLGINSDMVILSFSICVVILIGIIGVSVCKQFRQEKVQWEIINLAEEGNIDKKYDYNEYNTIPFLYERLIWFIFIFLQMIVMLIINICIFSASKSSWPALIISSIVSILVILLYSLLILWIGFGKIKKE